MSTQTEVQGNHDSRLSAKRLRRQGGFSLAELIVLLAVVGILSVMSTPFFLNYYRTAQVRGAASDIAAYLNQGRQLAIQRNTGVCVNITATTIRYNLGGCAGAAWIGPGTDAAGNINTPESITLTTTATPVFNYLGAAAPAATYTVTRGAYSLTVSVSASGRVLVGP